jgi:uncharacterized protein YjbI with pentapeptide repeats
MAPARKAPEAPGPPRWDAEPGTALPADPAAGLDELRLDGASLAGGRHRGVTIRDCELRACDLSTLSAREGRLLRSVVTGCRATGLDWPEGAVRDVTFRDCQLDLASFRFGALQRVVFKGCVLREADFAETRCESVRFDACDLTAASFERATFRRSELRGCTLEEIQGVEGLRGVAMEWADVVALAPTFARTLGIRLLE